MTRKRTKLVILALAGLIGSGMVMGSEKARAATTDKAPLTMEELEVRGRREKPDTLYLPVPRGIRHSAPVRFDLLREDISRPVLPWEIDSRDKPVGGKRDYR
ncbi:MAG: hypothetical protein R3239_05210 [Thermodesulfobacteriota bacterium]|nr:hypothetical protein [Thermodesulfobacteriota bacterium]